MMEGVATDSSTSTSSEKPRRPRRTRMTGAERREQLLDIGRTLFAAKGFEGTSVEEIAAKAGVSKPVVYEHFGGKEGLYAVVVDREMRQLLDMVTGALTAGHPRELLEQAAFALLDYIEAYTDGFRILVRDSPSPSRRAPSPPSSATSPPRSRTSSAPSSRTAASTRSWRRCTRRRWWGWSR